MLRIEWVNISAIRNGSLIRPLILGRTDPTHVAQFQTYNVFP